MSSTGLIREPTEAEVEDACLCFDHSFGLMSKSEQDMLKFTAKEWLRAWYKVLWEHQK